MPGAGVQRHRWQGPVDATTTSQEDGLGACLGLWLPQGLSALSADLRVLVPPKV